MNFSRLILGLLLSGVLAQPMAARAQAVEEKDYACALVLCLVNPNGAWAAPACHPPMRWLMRRLAKFQGFPVCSFANGGRASFHHEPHAQCAPGFIAQRSQDEGVNGYTGICMRQVSSCAQVGPPGVTLQCAPIHNDVDHGQSVNAYLQTYTTQVTQYVVHVFNSSGVMEPHRFNLGQ